MNYKFSSISKKGNIRKDNQDRVYSFVNEYNNFLGIVCDGIGGNPDGEIAASMVVKTISEAFESKDFNNLSISHIEKWFEKMISNSVKLMKSEVNNHNKSILMGTTLSGVLVTNKFILALNVGDSRVYRIDGKALYQITTDQNVKNSHDKEIKNKANEMINEQSSNLNQTDKTILKNRINSILVSAIGPRSKTFIDFYELDKRKNNRFFLATDGFYKFVKTEEVVAASEKENYSDALVDLEKAAEINESSDNLTGILLEVDYE